MNSQGRSIVLLLAFTLLVIPYLVDVVYLGDLTPTHFAQEFETEDQDCQTTFDIGFVSTTSVIDDSGFDEVSPSLRPPGALLAVASAKIFLLQYLASAALISRPPPSAHLS